MSFKFLKEKMGQLKLPEGQVQKDYYENLDGRTLVLTIGKRTSTWSVMFYVAGKTKRKKLGSWPAMEPKVARAAAREFVVESFASAEDEEEHKLKNETFKEATERFLASRVDGRNVITASEFRRHLERYVLPEWGARRFQSITVKQVSDLLEKIENDIRARVAKDARALRRRPLAGRSQRNAVATTLMMLKKWYEGQCSTYALPIVESHREPEPKPKTRWLDNRELKLLWAALETKDEQGKPKLGHFAEIVQLCLLTAQRSRKVAMMHWLHLEQYEKGKFIWHVPREDREKAVPPQLTLPPMANAIIARYRPFFGGSQLVFDGPKWKPYSAWSRDKIRLDAMLPVGFEPWTIHDLRRTARKLMTRAKVDSAVAELTLGHSLRGMVAVYDDPAEYVPAINEALVKIEEELKAILSSSE